MPSFKNRFGNLVRKISDSLESDKQSPTSQTVSAGGTEAATPLEVSFAAAMQKEAKGEDSTEVVVINPVAPEAVEEQHGEGAIAFLNFENSMSITDPSAPGTAVTISVDGTWDVYGYQDVDDEGRAVFQVLLTPMGRGDMEREFTQVFQRGMQREYALVHLSTLSLPSKYLLVGDSEARGMLDYENDVKDNPLSLIMTDAGLVFATVIPEVGISELRNRDGDVHGVLITSEI